MSMNLIKEQICDVCHKTWQLGWVAANDGNVSARLEDGTFLCTPTGMSKSFITPEKLLRINAKGEVAGRGLRACAPPARSRCICAAMKNDPMCGALSTPTRPAPPALR